MSEEQVTENVETTTETTETTENNTEATTENTKKKRGANVSMEKFIETWEEIANGPNPSVSAVAEKLGLAKETVGQRASAYRNPKPDDKGNVVEAIPLTKMPRGGGSRQDYSAGAALVEKLRKQREAQAAETSEGESEGTQSEA